MEGDEPNSLKDARKDVTDSEHGDGKNYHLGIRFFKLLIIGVAIPTIFLVAGAIVFNHLEYPSELERIEEYKEVHSTMMEMIVLIESSLNDSSIRKSFLDYLNITEPYLNSKASIPDESYPFWDIKGSSYFCWTIMTTIGYGTYAPTTRAGKAFCIVYTFVTVPIFLVALAVLSDLFYKVANSYLTKFRQNKILSKRKNLIIWVCGFFFLIILSAAYSQENTSWTYLDSVYFSIITLSTVGLGDYTPTLQAQHVFLFMLYCWVGMIAVGSMLASLQGNFDTSTEKIIRYFEQMKLVSVNSEGWKKDNIERIFHAEKEKEEDDVAIS